MPTLNGNARNAAQFRLGLSRLAEELPTELAHTIKQRLMLEGLKRVVQRTPVDTGRTRGNWQVSDDVPVTVPVVTDDPGGSRTLAAGAQVIAAVRPFSRSYISNPVPWFSVIEFGGYPRPGTGRLGFLNRDVNRQARSYRFVRGKDGTRRRVRISDRQRYRNAAAGEGQSKVTAEGYSRQAPRGVVRITMVELESIAEQVIAAAIRETGGAR